MADAGEKIRLFVSPDLYAGAEVSLNPDQAHYLFRVMRRREGSRLAVFNGRNGDWVAEVLRAGKRDGTVLVTDEGRPQRVPPDIWLLFSPIKRSRTDFIVEKAAELGVARVVPVFTRFTNSERVRTDRLRTHAIEAAEQCGENWVPEIGEPAKLSAVLSGWDASRKLVFCDEGRDAAPMAQALAGSPERKWAILTGPEGGFSPEEAEGLRKLAFVTPVTLGPRILRADTAAVAAVTLWQSVLGDWK